MKIRRVLRRTGIMLIVFLFCISCLPASVFARGSIETDRETALGVYFGKDGTGFPQTEFSVYRVADISENGTYTLRGDFAEYPVSLEDLDSSGWRALAQTLDAYAARDGLTPYQTKETGEDGKLRFIGLPAGLYLVTGEQYTDGNTIYNPEPMMISLPGLTEDGEWSYEIEAVCKYDCEFITDEPVSCKVQKVWKDTGNEDKRPEEISVQLLENGRVADIVILNQENNWEYTWENLDRGSKWQVVENRIADNYTVTITQETNVFVITNTRPSQLSSKLPQTGLLWWPVPVLFCGGLFFIAAGMITRRRQGEQDE